MSPLQRRSVEVLGLAHGSLPIPVACTIAGLLATGGIRGVDRSTGLLPSDVERQISLMFDNLAAVLVAGGANCETVIKVTIWVSDNELRPLINPAWIRMFPDPASRPARHILKQDLGPMMVQCEALAVVIDTGSARAGDHLPA